MNTQCILSHAIYSPSYLCSMLADGSLERDEVATALCSTSTPGRTTKALSDKLFEQLDFDGSGGISFKEFLIGLERMVMEEYEDDD